MRNTCASCWYNVAILYRIPTCRVLHGFVAFTTGKWLIYRLCSACDRAATSWTIVSRHTWLTTIGLLFTVSAFHRLWKLMAYSHGGIRADSAQSSVSKSKILLPRIPPIVCIIFAARLSWPAYDYTLNHKKRDILFLTITLANLNRFL